MTAKSTQSDDEIQEQWDRATRALARWLEPYMLEHTRWRFAQKFIQSMADQGFKPPLRPPKRDEHVDHEKARAAAARGAELARQALAHREDA